MRKHAAGVAWMSGRHYCVYDVFTGEALCGNQLAVVFDCDGLDTAAMQAIAREFNLSETVFVLPPDNPAHAARVRIFVPTRELPFAGHPTVGSALAIAELRKLAGNSTFILEEEVGNILCRVDIGAFARRAEFELPRLPELIEVTLDVTKLAMALSMPESELEFSGHKVSVWTAGVPYVLVPVKSISAVSNGKVDADAWLSLVDLPGAVPAAPYIYCAGGTDASSDFHARMLAPWDGIVEDPATGSAVAALSGALGQLVSARDGRHQWRIEQGVEMGRPSLIDLSIEMVDAALSCVVIGGEAVKIAEGRLFV
jgi:trans-2,3-dihydro-3-hydroxyanthranilate isomerase